MFDKLPITTYHGGIDSTNIDIPINKVVDHAHGLTISIRNGRHRAVEDVQNNWSCNLSDRAAAHLSMLLRFYFASLLYIPPYIYVNNGLLYCVSWKCRYIYWCLQRGFEFHYARYQKMIAEAMTALALESCWWTYCFRHLRMLVSRINRIFSVIGYRKSCVEIDTMLKARYISLCLSFILS